MDNKNLFKQVLGYWWLPVSFLLPYLVVALWFGVTRQEETLLRAYKSGLLGFAVSSVLWLIWRMDVLYGARQRLETGDRQTRVLVTSFGVVLWLCWFFAGVIVGMAYDQVYDMPARLPEYGGH
jgi:hypothetical protein